MWPVISFTHHLGGLVQSCCWGVPSVWMTSSPNLFTHLLEVNPTELHLQVLSEDETRAGFSL